MPVEEMQKTTDDTLWKEETKGSQYWLIILWIVVTIVAEPFRIAATTFITWIQKLSRLRLPRD